MYRPKTRRRKNIRLKVSVNGGGANGQNPGSHVNHRLSIWAVVSGGADNRDPFLDGVERSDGNWVDGEVGFEYRRRAERERQHVDAVGDRIVERGQDGGPAAALSGGADGVHGDPGRRGPALGRPGGEAVVRGVGHGRARGGRRHVGAVTDGVPRRKARR